jgi:hypothetical protein
MQKQYDFIFIFLLYEEFLYKHLYGKHLYVISV